MNDTTNANDIVRIWFGRRGAWYRQDAEGFTNKVNQSGLFRRSAAQGLVDKLGDEAATMRIEFDLVVAARPPRAVMPAAAPIVIDRPGLRDLLESSLRSLSAAANLPTGQAAMIEAQTADRLAEDLQALRHPAFAVRPGHLGEGASA